MSHKAYEFDWAGFERELAPLLREVLGNNDVEKLAEFVDRNREQCRDLSFGEPLTEAWRSDLTAYDVQQVGDLALTKYYDPLEDFGLAESWMSLSDQLPAEETRALIGEPFGAASVYFDPGYQGSYFQTPAVVRASAHALSGKPDLNPFLELLERAAKNGKGLYVTF
jgi:hypothetical protein